MEQNKTNKKSAKFKILKPKQKTILIQYNHQNRKKNNMKILLQQHNYQKTNNNKLNLSLSALMFT